jgi:phosphatidylinositol alpha-mannosyltransferase
VLTAVSPVAAAFHARMLGFDVGRFALVPNGVDVERFASHRAGGRRRPRLVFLGRLEHRKGVDVAVRAFLALASDRPDLELRVLGDGPLAPLVERLRQRAPAAVAARIELAGRADPERLPELLGDADVAILPARGGESFGIVLLEAMAAGVPIVATDIPGYRAVARHDREALLVGPGDVAASAAAIGRLLDEPALATRLRVAGRERAEEHDWAAIATTMQGVYRTAIARRTGAPVPHGPDGRTR